MHNMWYIIRMHMQNFLNTVLQKNMYIKTLESHSAWHDVHTSREVLRKSHVPSGGGR